MRNKGSRKNFVAKVKEKIMAKKHWFLGRPVMLLALGLVLGFALTGCRNSSQAVNQTNVFSLGGVVSPIVGVVVGDKVQFYSSEGDAWKTEPEADLALPKQ
jgi:hypothetical protein